MSAREERGPLSPHHIGYVVDDLASGVERFAAATGAGPFLAIEHMEFDEVTYRGGPATYDHSSAFGSCGSLLVEITQVFSAEPAELFEALGGARGIGHLGFLVDSPEDEVERLGAAGCEVFHTGRTGPAEATWLTGGELFGHSVELLRRAPELEGFYAQVREAAVGWDGSEALRRIA
ncbi:MAG TPA: VOC family protein [Solirubrobacterales bacterium]|nr:VOC family protein [Solirubrobacterales bacterium]